MKSGSVVCDGFKKHQPTHVLCPRKAHYCDKFNVNSPRANRKHLTEYANVQRSEIQQVKTKVITAKAEDKT